MRRALVCFVAAGVLAGFGFQSGRTVKIEFDLQFPGDEADAFINDLATGMKYAPEITAEDGSVSANPVTPLDHIRQSTFSLWKQIVMRTRAERAAKAAADKALAEQPGVSLGAKPKPVEPVEDEE